MSLQKLIIEVQQGQNRAREIEKGICALLNSGGGVLEFVDRVNSYQNIVDKVLKPVEQKLRKWCCTKEIQVYCQIKEKTDKGFVLHIQPGWKSLVTLKYHLYIPTESQVLMKECGSEVREIVDRKIVEVHNDIVPKSFTNNEGSGLHESQTVQFKKKFPNNCNLTTDNFSKYVSAFANHRGGHIYYGIDDDGIVEGKKVTEEQKESTTTAVKETVTLEMKYEGEKFPEEVKVMFVPVEDKTENSLYITVVSIPPYPGGVFTATPESYYLENMVNENKVMKMEYEKWLNWFKVLEQPWPIVVTPGVPRVPWSSDDHRKIYLRFTTELVRCRNENNIAKFKYWQRLASGDNYKNSSAPLVVMAEKVAVQYKKLNFKKAEKLLDKFSRSINEANNNAHFHDIKKLYLQSRIERAKGNYEKSYKIGETFLDQRASIVPTEFITAWFYMHLAMLANILGIRNNDESKFSDAKLFLREAGRDICVLDVDDVDFNDIHQKISIYRTMILLQCTLTGEVAQLAVLEEDIDLAAKEVTKVFESDQKGNALSDYRKVHFLFAQISIRLRRSEILGLTLETRLRYLRESLELVQQAKTSATRGNFKDLEKYTQAFKREIKKRRRGLEQHSSKQSRILCW